MSASLIRIAGCLILVSMLLLPAGALAAPDGSETIHVVQWGETLSLIASRYGVTVEAIMAANGLSDPSFIYVGQRLLIPSSGTPAQGGSHVVAAGDTLTSIAWRYGTTVAALAAANSLSDTDFIYVGQILNVPGGQPSAPGPISGGCSSYYTAQWGDTLSGIAWRHGTTINALMQANNLYSDFIYQGQRLCVPPGGAAWVPSKPSYTYYTVRAGDTLSGIAWHFGVSQVAIMQANNLSNPSFIYVGQRLLIPGVAPSYAKGKVYKIAFARWDGGKHNLYVANTDGSDEKLLLERAAGPSWSPDGQRLSLFGEEGVDRQREDTNPVVFEGISNGILTIPASLPEDLSQLNVVQIERDGKARAAAWSPDGNSIAWDSNPGGSYHIYFYGKKDTPAEGQSAIEIPGEHPDWSPDGSQVVYRSGRDGKQGLWISDRWDSAPRRITDDGSDAFPRWSPNGKQIAFHRESGGNVDVYVMNADGSNIRRLTDSPGQDTLPAWTPDGRIVFRSVRDGSWGIYIMDANGRGQKQIIGYADPGPDWAFGQMDVY